MGLRSRIRDLFKGFGAKEHDLTANPPFYDMALLPTSAYARSTTTEYLDANVVMSPVMWIMRLIVEAHAIIQSRRAAEREGQKPIWEHSVDHEVELLLDEPNPYYDGDILWQATIASYAPCGNAYWWKTRNDIGDVVQLWYLPHWLVRPVYPTDGSRYTDYYEYRSGAVTIRIPPRNIVHFRFGLDPRDIHLGLGPIGTILREVMTDEEAALFSAAILKNMGVPGLLVSPKDNAVRPSDQDVRELKEYMNTAFSGAKRGRAAVLGVPTDVNQFGFDPNKLMLANLRDISEERVCAALGLPAAVVGFGSGMQSTKVGATMRELVKMSWVQCLSPMTKSLAKQATRQLLSDFVSQRRRFRIRFDTSEVSGFQEDDNQLSDRIVKQVQAGILRVDRAQSMLGLEVDETQKIYLRPSNSLPVDEQGNPIEPPATETAGNPDAAVLARMNGNGNGNGAEAE